MLRNNLKKIDLAKDLSKKIGFSSSYSKKIINELIEIIILNIKKDDLTLKNFGTFKIRKKKNRLGRNPKTKEKFTIFARNSVVFIPSKKINEMLKNI